jgi:hypothetical protein
MHQTKQAPERAILPGRQVHVMMQSTATFKRDTAAAYIAFEGPVLMRAADSAQYDEDDAVMDSFLASLDSREFELILSRLADTQPSGLAAMGFSA